MTREEIDNLIIENIYTNDAGLITGIILQEVLLSMVEYNAESAHTHVNKSILDQLTQANLDVLSRLSIVDNKLRVNSDMYSTGEISAYGVGIDPGGGAGASALSELNDVALTVPNVGDLLLYNGTHWVNRPQSTIMPDLSQLENHLSNFNNPHQVQFSQLLNKPTTLSGYGITDAAALNHNHSGVYEPAFTKNTAFNKNFGTSAGTVSEGNHTHTFASITSKPTTLSGYGISDAYTKTETDTKLSLKLDKSIFDDLFEKVEVSAGIFAIKAKYNFYSVGEVSAYGVGSGTGGGSISYNRLDAWIDYDSTKSGWVLSALLGNDLNTRVTSLEGGSTLAVNTTGTGNAITAITKSGTTITANKGATFAELDGNGKVISSQLPSYVDDVIEAASLANFPATGETGKIYIAQDTNKTYRWSGTAYVEISASLALGETSSTAYRGDRGKIAYDHSQIAHQSILNGTGFVKVSGTTVSYDNNTYSLSTHNHSGIYEPVFTKNTAFNKNFGTAAGTVSEGNHTHTFASLTSKPTTLSGYGITDAYTKTEVNTALALKLDKSTFDDLFEKVEVSTGVYAIKAKYDFYSVGEVSAYGAGTGGGSVSYNRLDAWADYTSDKSGWVLSALLGNDLNTRLSVLEAGGSGSYQPLDADLTSIAGLTGTSGFLKKVSVNSWELDTNSYAIASHTHTFASLTSKPTTLAGYGITDAANINHTHAYLPLTGGTLSGALNFANNTWNVVGDDTALGDCNIGGMIGIKGLNREYAGIAFFTPSNTPIGQLKVESNVLKFNDNVIYHAGNFTNLNQLTTRNFSDLQNKPTTLAGYGITDAANINHTHGLTRYSLAAPAFIDGLTTSNFRTTLFGSSTSGYNISTARWDNLPLALSGLIRDSTMIAWSGADTHGFLALSWCTPSALIGGGNGDNIVWSATLLNSLNYNNYAPTKTGVGASGTWNIGITGNASTATKLQTARTIAGVSFDGTANIDIPFANLSSKPTTLSGYGISVSDVLTQLKTIDGAGSGLDADLLDGLNGNNFLKTGFTINGDIDAYYPEGTQTFDPIPAGNPPIQNPNIRTLNLGDDFARRTQLAFPYNLNLAFLRYRIETGWSNWREFAFTDSNVASATKLQTARTLWGQSFDGTGNVSGNLTSVGSITMNGSISGATTISASTSVTTPKIIFAAAGWSVEQTGTEIQFKYNGVIKQRLLSDGSIVAVGEVTAYG